MKHKTAELEGPLLEAAVARADGHAEIEIDVWTDGRNPSRKKCQVVLPGEDGERYWTDYEPSNDWATAGPIIERERISTYAHLDFPCDRPPAVLMYWVAVVEKLDGSERRGVLGQTPLIAAMRAFVASKLGDEVELPD
jgi:hypothetical protein